MSEHEKAVTEFSAADEEYQGLKKYMEGGEFLKDILEGSQGNFPAAKEMWDQVWKKLDELNEDRNAKLKTAKDTLRRAVQLSPQVVRGPEGRPTVLTCGPFTVSSVTHRGLDPDRLLSLCDQEGVGQEVRDIAYSDKSGATRKAVEVECSVHYETAISWLKARGLTRIVEAAYVEYEKTPTVKGPKETAMLGEYKKD